MKRALRQFHKSLILGMLAYFVLLPASIMVTKTYAEAIWRFPVALAPMAPFIYVMAACVRYIRMIDELQRLIALEALAIGFGGTAAVTFAYGFLERAGLPHINWMWVWPVMGAFWILGQAIAERRYR